MKYYKYTWNDRTMAYDSKEMTEEQALSFLARYYKDVECFRGKVFRVNTMFGYVESRSESGLAPAPGFCGICG